MPTKNTNFHRDEIYQHYSDRSWGIFNWYNSFGIYIYTGAPSAQNGAYWHDIELTREAVDSAPDAVMDCIEALLSLATNPLLTMTADGGLRFSCRIIDYLHPRSERVYNYKERPYLGILGEKGYSPWNARHEIVTGNLLSPPTLDKALIFAAVDAFTARLEKDTPPKPKFTGPNRTTSTSIVEPDPETILQIRKGQLSPLAIKRPKPILTRQHSNAANGHIPENENQDILAQYKHTIRKKIRVLGISTGINTVNKAEYVEDGITVSTMSELTEFVRYEIKIKQIQDWYHNHEYEPLGNFARMLLNALTTQSTQHAASVQRLRTAMQTFLWKEADIVKQMKPDAENWFQLKRFFACYNCNADTPIHYDEENQTLEFWLPPPKIHPEIKQLRLFAQSISYPILKKIFHSETVATTHIAPKPLSRNTKIFQLRSGIHPAPEMSDYSVDRKFHISKLARSFTKHIKAEQKRNLNFFHAVRGVIQHNFVDELSSLKDADVLWILGLPQLELRQLWIRSMRIFGSEKNPLNYDYSETTGIYKDARVQAIYEDHAINSTLTEINEFAPSKRINKTLIILSAITIPGITDHPETQFFDWQDFLIAGSLDKLSETIAVREGYECQRDTLTAESTRQEIERIYGCTSRHANRIRQNLSGGQPLRTPLGDQILACLADGEKSTKEILAIVDGHPTAIRRKLKDLVDNTQIRRIRHGSYKHL